MTLTTHRGRGVIRIACSFLCGEGLFYCADDGIGVGTTPANGAAFCILALLEYLAGTDHSFLPQDSP